MVSSAHQLHAVFGAGLRLDDYADYRVRRHHAAAFAGDKALQRFVSGHHDAGRIDIGILREGRGEAAHKSLHRLLLRGGRHFLVIGVGLRGFLAEIRRQVVFLGIHLRFGLHIQKCVGGPAVLAEGHPPERVGNRPGIVIERQGIGIDRRGPVLAMRVVQRRSADPHDDVRHPLAAGRAGDQAAIDADGHGFLLVVHRVADEVGGRGQLAQLCLGALQLLVHAGENNVVSSRCCRGVGPGRCLATQNCSQPHQPTGTNQFSHLSYFSPNTQSVVTPELPRQAISREL